MAARSLVEHRCAAIADDDMVIRIIKERRVAHDVHAAGYCELERQVRYFHSVRANRRRRPSISSRYRIS